MSDKMTRVLIVEDNIDLREGLHGLLEHLGFSVEVAADAAEGIALGLNREFDVALVDLHLGAVSGFELAVRLREAGRTVRLVAVSGHPRDAVEDQARVAGFDDLLAKPFAMYDLQRVLGHSTR